MTTADQLDRAATAPIGLITDLVTDVEKQLGAETIRAVVTAVAGGFAKSRQLTKAVSRNPIFVSTAPLPTASTRRSTAACSSTTPKPMSQRPAKPG